MLMTGETRATENGTPMFVGSPESLAITRVAMLLPSFVVYLRSLKLTS